MKTGQWKVKTGQWKVDSGEWTVENEEGTVESEKRKVKSGKGSTAAMQKFKAKAVPRSLLTAINKPFCSYSMV